MRYVFRFWFAFALSLALMAGCSDDGSEGGSGGTAGTGGMAGTGGSAGGGGSAEGSVSAVDPGDTSVPVVGVNVCQLDTTNCAETGEDGRAALMLPVGETGFTADKEGHVSSLQLVDVPSGGFLFQVGMFPDEFASRVYEEMMSPYPMEGTGSILVHAAPRRAGVTFDLVGGTGKLFYVNEDGSSWRTDLTATTSFGYGGFVEVPPGDYEVTFGGTAEGCTTPLNSWPGDTENSVRVRVEEGHITWAAMLCPTPP
jgi:hypothetical protein